MKPGWVFKMMLCAQCSLHYFRTPSGMVLSIISYWGCCAMYDVSFGGVFIGVHASDARHE